MPPKDNFSSIASQYAQWRPDYPKALFDFIASLCVEKNSALDCGTGNGQAAKFLAAHFKKVFATDISRSQISNAIQLPNIFYRVTTAEKTSFENNSFDLICAAQAAHWFNHELFFAEAERIAKPDAILSFVGYGLLKINQKIDPVIYYLYKDILGKYWDAERKYIDENYETLPFPYKTIQLPEFEMVCNWNFEHLLAYLKTWSAVGHYFKEEKKDPISFVEKELKINWGNPKEWRVVKFPILNKTGKLLKSDFI